MVRVKKVLIAGATGGIGREAVRAAKAAGWFVRATGRRISKVQGMADEAIAADALDPAALRGLADGADAVLSCLGAPLSMTSADKRSLFDVDTKANQRVLEEAQRAGVKRFVYVSMALGEGYNHTTYVQSHERFVQMLQASGIANTIIRPTGVFWAMAEMLDYARKGMLPVIAGGSARTNPVHEADVAEACVSALEDGPAEISIGGPEIFTRKQIADEMFHALGKPPKTLSLPTGIFRLIAGLQGIGSPRKKELFDFFAAVATSECVAPPTGKRNLREYLKLRAT